MQTICQSLCPAFQADDWGAALSLAAAAAHRRCQRAASTFRSAYGGDCAQVRLCRSGMFHPGVPEIARHYAWGVAADTHAIVCVPGFPVTQRKTEPRVRLASKESRMKFANA